MKIKDNPILGILVALSVVLFVVVVLLSVKLVSLQKAYENELASRINAEETLDSFFRKLSVLEEEKSQLKEQLSLQEEKMNEFSKFIEEKKAQIVKLENDLQKLTQERERLRKQIGTESVSQSGVSDLKE